MDTPQKGKGYKWWILHGIVASVDAVQALIGWTGIGTIVSEALEIAMPFFIVGYSKFILKISIFSHPTRLLSIFGAGSLGFITGGVAPFWVLDTWYLQGSVKREDAANLKTQQQEKLVENDVRDPFYVNEMRLPRNPDGTVNTQYSGTEKENAAREPGRQPPLISKPPVIDSVRVPKKLPPGK